jgi:hypothetical protein
MRQPVTYENAPLAQSNLALYRSLFSGNFSDHDVQRIHDAYLLSTQLFAQQFRADGRPFVTHLVGTASAALNYGQDLISNTDGVVAGMLHAAYTQGEFGDSLSQRHPAHRERVRAVTGRAAEELIYSYDDTPWPPPEDVKRKWLRKDVSAISLNMRRIFALKAVNELDDLKDFAPLYVGDTKRQSVEKGAHFAVIVADTLGLLRLREALLVSLKSLDDVDIPQKLCSTRNGAYSVNSVRLREQILRVVRGAIRKT